MPLDDLDRRIADFMADIGVRALRYSLGIIFIWFGILKPLGLSADSGSRMIGPRSGPGCWSSAPGP